MAGLEVSQASKSFGDVAVLRDIDFKIGDGEFLVIVGPSGCGKSTLLRSIAGLEELNAGSIIIGDKRVDDLAPAERGIAMVFQSYALYPHMSLYENMAFALRLAKRPQAEIDEAVHNAAEILGIRHLLDRKPSALSGGQRQRVAIGRAIVRKPQIFLFDEPLSNLDAALRVKMRYEFASLHKELATTTVYVTHDQVEAMTLADRILVLQAGKVEQFGSPAELYDHPANQFVAGFIGSPKMNFLPGKLIEAAADHALVELKNGQRVTAMVDARRLSQGDSVLLGVRPEHIERADQGGAVETEVRFVEQLGGSATIHLKSALCDEALIWQARDERSISEGQKLSIQLPADRLYLFDDEGIALQRTS